MRHCALELSILSSIGVLRGACKTEYGDGHAEKFIIQLLVIVPQYCCFVY